MTDKRDLLLIITARLGSSRLPGKVLMPFWDQYSILEFLIKRLQTKPETSRLVLATVDNPENDSVAEIGKKTDIKVVRGPEKNVLKRMLLCLEDEDTDFVCRVTADNPFTDPELILLQLDEMKRIKADYSYCKQSPKGTAADIWTTECFLSTVANAGSQFEKEHVNAWVWGHPELYNILWFVSCKNIIRPKMNLSIDTKGDYEQISRYASSFENPLLVNVASLINACKT